MINKIGLSNKMIGFRANQITRKPEKDEESEIVPNTLSTRLWQKYDKVTNAFIEYPAKGLQGNVNSDFYEFLTMGVVPYIIGSLMFITMFNMLNGHISKQAALRGKKFGLGVLFYGLAKILASNLVTYPVSYFTGVDIELPYKNIYDTLPTKPGAEADIDHKHQQRKVYDSIEFFRKDLIAKHPDYGVAYYDKIAKKNGLGENLNDSVSETTPIIQSIVSMTKTAKSLSSYAWAGVGVGLAVQDSWADFFKALSERAKYTAAKNDGFITQLGGKLKTFGKNSLNITKAFGKSFITSCKTLWTGEPGKSGFIKHAGKVWLLSTIALTTGLTANAILRPKHMGKLVNNELIDSSAESTVI